MPAEALQLSRMRPALHSVVSVLTLGPVAAGSCDVKPAKVYWTTGVMKSADKAIQSDRWRCRGLFKSRRGASDIRRKIGPSAMHAAVSVLASRHNSPRRLAAATL